MILNLWDQLAESVDQKWAIAELARKIAPSGAKISPAMWAWVAFLVSSDMCWQTLLIFLYASVIVLSLSRRWWTHPPQLHPLSMLNPSLDSAKGIQMMRTRMRKHLIRFQAMLMIHMALNERTKTKTSFHAHGRLVSSGIMLILNWRSSMMKYATSSQKGIFRMKNLQSMCHIIVFINPSIYCSNRFFTEYLQEDWKMYPSMHSWLSFMGNVTYPPWQEAIHKKCSW